MMSCSGAQLHRAGLDAATLDALRNPDQALLKRDLAWLEPDGNDLLTWQDQRYPELLRAIPGAPLALWVVGDPDLLWQPQVAMVGSRNPTAGGLDHARSFASELARMGFTITSGMAAGIDAASHEAALATPAGATIAVLGTGPDIVYPARNTALAGRIAQAGALVTELPPGTPAKASHFPSRNRIISGLSLGVLVVEASVKSGSLITARMAGEQGREVFALPGSLHNPLARGCHQLIKQGAQLTETVQDLVAALAPLAGELARSIDAAQSLDEPGRGPVAGPGAALGADDDDYQKLLTAIGFDPEPLDRVIERSGLSAREVSSMLLKLELDGRIELHPGARVSCLKQRS